MTKKPTNPRKDSPWDDADERGDPDRAQTSLEQPDEVQSLIDRWLESKGHLLSSENRRRVRERLMARPSNVRGDNRTMEWLDGQFTKP